MNWKYSLALLIALPTSALTAQPVILDTVKLVQDISGTPVTFPVLLSLEAKTTASGVTLEISADIGLQPLQTQFDALAKSFEMPRDNCPGYGQHVTARVQKAALNSVGSEARVSATVHAAVWDCQRGVPMGNTTIEWKIKCYRILGKRICTKVPTKVEARPGPDIKNRLYEEDLDGIVTLTLVTPDGQSLEVRGSDANVTPRGDVARYLNAIVGIFRDNLGDYARNQVRKLVDAGALRQTIPPEVIAFSPTITEAQFRTSADAGLSAHVQFSAVLTPQQLTDLVTRSIGQNPTP